MPRFSERGFCLQQNKHLSRAEHSPAHRRVGFAIYRLARSKILARQLSCRAPLSSHCANFGRSLRVIFAVKKDDRLIASNARSDLLGKNRAQTRNSSLNLLFSSFLHGIVRKRPLLVLRASVAKSFWCYLLSVQKVAETLQTRLNGLILRYFCLTKVTKNNPDDENLLRSPSEIGKRATTRFCEQNVPVSFPISRRRPLNAFSSVGDLAVAN